MTNLDLTARQWVDVQTVWDYHQLDHRAKKCDAAIVLGSFDIGVAEHAATVFHRGLVPILVVSGAVTPGTRSRFPDGEAIAYQNHLRRRGVNVAAILTETQAMNTGENIEFSRQILQHRAVVISDLLLVTMPYMQRRAYATCARQWPDVTITCSAETVPLADYLNRYDATLVINDMVGDLERILRYPQRGYAIPQHVPPNVKAAYERLRADGFTARTLASGG